MLLKVDTWTSKRLNKVKTVKLDWIYWNSLIRALTSQNSFGCNYWKRKSNKLKELLVHVNGKEKGGSRVLNDINIFSPSFPIISVLLCFGLILSY